MPVHLIKGYEFFRNEPKLNVFAFYSSVLSLQYVFFHYDIKEMSDDPLIV